MERENVLFKYEPNTIKEKACSLTGVIGASRATEEGVLLYDRIVMTEDDYIIADQYMGEALLELNKRIMAYLAQVRPIRCDDSGLITGIEFEVETPEEYGSHILAPLNEAILNFLVYYITTSWLTLKAPDLSEYYSLKTHEYIDDVLSLLHRRKEAVRRRYTYY